MIFRFERNECRKHVINPRVLGIFNFFQTIIFVRHSLRCEDSDLSSTFSRHSPFYFETTTSLVKEKYTTGYVR